MEMQMEATQFDYAQRSVKTSELIIFDNIGKTVKLLDAITIKEKDTEHAFNVTVIALSWHDNFYSAFEDGGLMEVAPSMKNISEAVRTYEKFPNYKDGARQYGVLRIKFVQ